MTREKISGIVWGVIAALLVAGVSGGFAMAFDTREKVAVAESRLNSQAEDIREIKSDVKELLKRTVKP